MGLRKLFAVCAVGFLLCGFHGGLTTDQPPSQFQLPLKIGGGGWNVGMDICQADGTRYARTDTYGALILNAGATVWTQLVTQTSMPSAQFGFQPATGSSQVAENSLGGGGPGVYEITSAPSNCNVVYMMTRGWIFSSTNKGTSWTKTAFGGGTAVAMASNDAYRTVGRKMDVDPINANVVFAGTDALGMFVTRDGGATFAAVSGLPTSTGSLTTWPNYNIKFDPSSASITCPVVGGSCTGTLYAYTNGSTAGVYISTDGGVTWTITTAGPTTVQHMVVAPTGGVVWVCDGAANANGSAWALTGTSWHKFVNTNAPNSCHSVAVDPNDATHVVFGTTGGNLVITNNSGTTWAAATTISRVATDVPWLQVTNEGFMSNGDMIFNGSGELDFSEGIGFWTTTPVTGSTVWTSLTAGMEQMVARQVIAPNGVPIVGVSDRSNFYLSSPNTYPSTQNTVYGNSYSLNVTWGFDYASTNSNYIAAVTGIILSGVGNNSGFSTDGGQIFKPFNSYYQAFTGSSSTIANNGSGLVRITVASTTGLTTWSATGNAPNGSSGSIVRFINSNGAPATLRGAAGGPQYWPITVIDSTHFDLQGSGSLIAGVAALQTGNYYVYVDTSPPSDNNGVFTVTGTSAEPVSNLIKISVTGSTANLFAAGQMICMSGVGGTTEANGCWTASNVTNTSFDLVGSNFINAWTSGGVGGKMLVGGGSVAASTPLNIAIMGNNNDYPWCSTDGGSSLAGWTKIALPTGVAANGNTGWNSSSNFNRKNIAADRVTSNTIYLFNESSLSNTYTIYTLTNCIVTNTVTGTIGSGAASLQMVTVPGYAGHMLVSPGVQGTPGSLHPVSGALRWSNNAGSTFTAITNTNEARSVGVGAIAPGSDYPTVDYVGWYGGVATNVNCSGALGPCYGIWRSTSTAAQWAANTVTWTQVGTFPDGSDDVAVTISGDGLVWNKWYMGWQGSSYTYGQQNFLYEGDLHRGAPANDNDDVPVGLNKAA